MVTCLEFVPGVAFFRSEVELGPLTPHPQCPPIRVLDESKRDDIRGNSQDCWGKGMQNSFLCIYSPEMYLQNTKPFHNHGKGTLRSNHGNPKQPLFECAHECAKVRSCAPKCARSAASIQPLIFAKTLNSLARAELTVIGTKVNQQTKAKLEMRLFQLYESVWITLEFHKFSLQPNIAQDLSCLDFSFWYSQDHSFSLLHKGHTFMVLMCRKRGCAAVFIIEIMHGFMPFRRNPVGIGRSVYRMSHSVLICMVNIKWIQFSKNYCKQTSPVLTLLEFIR